MCARQPAAVTAAPPPPPAGGGGFSGSAHTCASSASAARSFPAQHCSAPSQAGGGFARRLLPAYHLQQT